MTTTKSIECADTIQPEHKKERIEWIDTARGIGILLVILGHFDGLGKITVWIYSFHLPLFLFLSGFLSKNNLSPCDFIKKKVKTLIVPYIFLSIGIVAFSIVADIYKQRFSLSLCFSTLWSFCIQRRQNVVWFLAFLFILELLFYFLSKFLNKFTLFIICILMPVIGLFYIELNGPYLPWNVDVCFMAIPFYYLGYIFKYYKIFDYFPKNKTKLAVVFCFFLICNIGFCILNYRLSDGRVDMYSSCYGSYPLMVLSAIGGIGAIILISAQIKNVAITHIGKNSLIYFGWHNIFIRITNGLVPQMKEWFAFESTWDSFIAFILVLIMCAIVENIVTRTKLKVLIGKF